jgi:hypothetical protein
VRRGLLGPLVLGCFATSCCCATRPRPRRPRPRQSVLGRASSAERPRQSVLGSSRLTLSCCRAYAASTRASPGPRCRSAASGLPPRATLASAALALPVVLGAPAPLPILHGPSQEHQRTKYPKIEYWSQGEVGLAALPPCSPGLRAMLAALASR